MLDFGISMLGAPVWALLMGYSMDRMYRQSVTYNLMGKAAKKRISSRRADNAVKKSFKSWNWMLTAGSLYSVALAIILYTHGPYMKTVYALAIMAGALFILSLINLTRSYILADKELL